MTYNNIFFDVPVYRLSEDEYELEWKKSNAYIVLQNTTSDYKDSAYEVLRREFGGTWEYNEIIVNLLVGLSLPKMTIFGIVFDA